ncbi:molybdenum cofactor guanylyltransferase MobA [Dokdonella sp.]|uniref:molybdenum cofactor guanylyltransferase MobA n=1 Tax=Dokdonella sp. TaxID=2291710 RepID=UPI001B2F5242|nr:molybdenum cofactor guanylyltransferase MobA [Dokdonella sp.]MBO9664533.1 molybdenum cofactor guanylyltransferase [Dokdonella sp.]
MRAALTIAILAGGAATRLQGRDKGLEPLCGRPLVAWTIEAAAAMAAVPILIVANRNPDAYAAFARTIRDDLAGFRGPLAGVAAALAVCDTPWLMTLPVDCPQPPRDLAVRLLDATRAESTKAAVAHDGERRQPLFAIYRRELAPDAATAAAQGQGVWQWQNAIGARELDFADRRAQFRNLNTPEDFAAYAAEHAR